MDASRLNNSYIHAYVNIKEATCTCDNSLSPPEWQKKPAPSASQTFCLSSLMKKIYIFIYIKKKDGKNFVQGDGGKMAIDYRFVLNCFVGLACLPFSLRFWFFFPLALPRFDLLSFFMRGSTWAKVNSLLDIWIVRDFVWTFYSYIVAIEKQGWR